MSEDRPSLEAVRWLEIAAREYADHPALEFEGAVVTWSALAEEVAETVAWLAAAGFGRGHVVAVLAENSLVWPRWLHALAACGAPLLALNSRLTADELVFQLMDARAVLLVAGPGAGAARIGAISHACVDLRVIGVNDRGQLSSDSEVGEAAGSHIDGTAGRPARSNVSVEEPVPLALLYTSGTTGRPKGVELTARAFVASALGSQLAVPLEAGDRWLACMPLYHVGGLSVLIRTALVGATAIVHRRFDAQAVVNAIETGGISHVSFVANMLDRVLALRGDALAPPGLRCVLLGGGPAPDGLIERAWQLGYPVSPTYGLTETCSQLATRLPGDRARPVAGRLRVLPGFEARVRDDQGKTHATSAEGEIIVRGAGVTLAHVGHAAGLTPLGPAGWFATGDIGRIDAEGLIEVLDRRDDLIVSGGENIYPAEVESVLVEHEAVSEAAVVARSDRRHGARPVAYWSSPSKSEDVTRVELEAHVRGRLAGYKVPVDFIRLDVLPRTSTGKLRRAVLRALEQDGTRHPSS